MRHNIAIVLNAKTKKEAHKEMYETIDLFRENMHMDTEYESTCLTKEYIEEQYENFKQKYRDLDKDDIKSRLEHSGAKDIEEYIQNVLDMYGWSTLEDYAKERYNIIRFEEDKCIGIYNPRGYIDYVDSILCMKKYKNISTNDIKRYRIAEIVLKDKASIEWNIDKTYKDNKLVLKQALRKDINPNDYLAIVRVHY